MNESERYLLEVPEVAASISAIMTDETPRIAGDGYFGEYPAHARRWGR
jgi:hypothetical protein